MLTSRIAFEEEHYADRIARFKKFKALEMAKKYLRLIALHKVLPNTEQYKEKVRQFAKTLVSRAKEKFHGKMTYASLPDEDIDWSDFDIVGVNLYEDASNKASYAQYSYLRGLPYLRKYYFYFRSDRKNLYSVIICCSICLP